MAFSMLKIRRPLGRLIFNMGIAIPGKTVFLIETAPSMPCQTAIDPKSHEAIQIIMQTVRTRLCCIASIYSEVRFLSFGEQGLANEKDVAYICTRELPQNLHRTMQNKSGAYSSGYASQRLTHSLITCVSFNVQIDVYKTQPDMCATLIT